jgi:hypothetical protein
MTKNAFGLPSGWLRIARNLERRTVMERLITRSSSPANPFRDRRKSHSRPTERQCHSSARGRSGMIVRRADRPTQEASREIAERQLAARVGRFATASLCSEKLRLSRWSDGNARTAASNAVCPEAGGRLRPKLLARIHVWPSQLRELKRKTDCAGSADKNSPKGLLPP